MYETENVGPRVPEERYCFCVFASSGSATVLHFRITGGGDAGHLATHTHYLVGPLPQCHEFG